jgi:regulation of enolase protein 1 (concanavalin A-like superfamily)
MGISCIARSISGDFTAQVKFLGQYHDLYDQAGLIVRADAQTRMKCGVEFVDGKQNVSVVFTRDFSDWSTARLPEGTGAVWIRVVGKGPALDIFYSLDGSQWIESRQGYLSPANDLLVGPMCATPEGKGFEVRFEDWKVEKASK